MDLQYLRKLIFEFGYKRQIARNSYSFDWYNDCFNALRFIWSRELWNRVIAEEISMEKIQNRGYTK